ncbi:MAG: tetratricopeptide repeat protein [Candidatus Helarchaeota archaeon]
MLPIKSAILYKTGIGYFERTGKVDLGKTNNIVMSFKKKLMNDILASLSVSSNNALVTGVSYEGSEIDLDRALEDCLIKVPEHDSFLALLKQLVGSRIEIKLSNDTITGIVLGIQKFEKGVEGTDEKIMEPYLVIADDNGDIKNILISDMTGPNSYFNLNDERMNNELKYFLETIYTSKKRDAKSMTIFLEQKPDATGISEVSISYLHEVPSWKASYRLLQFPNEVVIQGFGLIDNPTDEDWDDINLILVAGLPISFIYDLYTPNYIQRPTKARRESYDITPTSYEEAIEDFTGEGMKTNFADGIVSMAKDTRKFKGGDISTKQMKEVLQSTKVGVSGSEAGDFFQYQITAPITVKRNQSSLVPILQSKITSKRMSVYNEKVRKDNPMLTVELTNDTGLTLEEGPISVFEADNYSGESMLPFLKKDEKRRIGYAVDLGVLVAKKTEEKSLNFHKIKFEYNIKAFQYLIKKVEYIVKNKSDDPKEVVIEHAKEDGFKLFETPDPFEESKNYYRYKLSLGPKSAENSTVKLEIKTRKVVSAYYYYQDVSKYDIEEWYKLKLIDEAKKDFLLKVWKASNQLKNIKNEIQTKAGDKNKISNDQTRLRNNIKVLRTSHSERTLREKYVKKLETQEEILENLEEEIEKLNNKVKNLEYLINALNKLDNKDATSLNNIAWGFYLTEEDGNLVVEYAQKALEIDNEKGFIWDTLACGYYRIGKYKEAYEAFQKAIELSPKGEDDITKEIYFKVKAQYTP